MYTVYIDLHQNQQRNPPKIIQHAYSLEIEINEFILFHVVKVFWILLLSQM